MQVKTLKGFKADLTDQADSASSAVTKGHSKKSGRLLQEMQPLRAEWRRLHHADVTQRLGGGNNASVTHLSFNDQRSVKILLVADLGQVGQGFS